VCEGVCVRVCEGVCVRVCEGVGVCACEGVGVCVRVYMYMLSDHCTQGDPRILTAIQPTLATNVLPSRCCTAALQEEGPRRAWRKRSTQYKCPVQIDQLAGVPA